MKRVVAFELEDGSPVYVEAEAPDGAAGPQRVGRSDENGIEKAQRRFEDAIQGVRPATQALLETLRGADAPDEIRLEVGLKFNASAGVILASVDSEAVFKVCIVWKNAARSV